MLPPVTPDALRFLRERREVARKLIEDATTPDEYEYARSAFDDLDGQIRRAEAQTQPETP